jgi:hypothetical protein
MTNKEIEKLLKIWRANANYEGKYPPPYALMSVQLNNACDLIEELIKKYPSGMSEKAIRDDESNESFIL